MQLYGLLGPPTAVSCSGEHDSRALSGANASWSWTLQGDKITSCDGLSVAIVGEPLIKDAAGHWRTVPSPAESVASHYQKSGAAFLQQLGGRFALAVVDAGKGRAILAVDPMGIDRLAFSVVDGTVVFGTSAESVARSSGRAARLNHDALLDYLMLHMVPAPTTIFSGVQKLRPGHCAIFDNGSCRISRYHEIRFVEQVAGAERQFAEYRTELFRSLRAAVTSSAPDQATGAFLSGGLDSSTVAGLLSEVSMGQARTFTIGFGYPDYDEFPYSRAANAHFKCSGAEYVITAADIADGFARIAQAYDEPFGNSSALPVYYCARFASERGVRHLLAGDGGDELFAGNTRYAEQEVFERYQRIPKLLRSGLIEGPLKLWPRQLDFWLTRKTRGYVSKANTPLPERLETWNLLQQAGLAQLLHRDFLATVNPRHTFESMQELWDSAPADSSLNKMLFYDWQFTLADNDLRKVNTMSALAGVQVSYPMLHPDVVDLAAHLPVNLKMPGARLRDFYKRAMDGFLPAEIIHKKKHGFSLPFGLWLQVSPELRERIHDNLRALRSRNIMNPEFIDRLLQLHWQDDAKYYGVFIWVLAMLEQWLQEHKLSV
jgi:asparagine synthase (glutamine-hydrolysing)